MKHIHDMPFGARLNADGGARFRLWAPAARTVELVRSAGPDTGDVRMPQAGDGWYELSVPRAGTDTRYAFRIDGDLLVPDPASRSNPDDVHRASALIDPGAFHWPDVPWTGRPWNEAVIYELHVGCFTEAGTFSAAIERLDDLVALGITAIELLPVAAFPGRRGWGYDGVLPFAPEASYGTPDDLKGLVAAAHQRGLMVLLDVVYNHFGPDGNYLHAYAKPFFNDAVQTPWGSAIHFDGADHGRTVRDFFIHNALYWVEEFQMDGLRVDAVHAIHDRSQLHVVDELSQAVASGPGLDRHVHVVLENHDNDAARLARDGAGQPTLAVAQWNDDAHHAFHVLATGETDGYYIDFAADPLRLLGSALAEGFVFQGQPSAFGGGHPRGQPSAHLPPIAFVNSLQTHDQVGNRAFGDRIAAQCAEAGRSDALRALTICWLLSPPIPMLFMGEEYAASTPFQYFCDFDGKLAHAVTLGRRKEFGSFARFADPAARERIPDPNAVATFDRSKLDWTERARGAHRETLALYADLLRLRHAELVPWLAGARSGSFSVDRPGTLRVSWPLAGGRQWHLLARLADSDAPTAVALPGDPIWRSHEASDNLPAWSVQVTRQDR